VGGTAVDARKVVIVQPIDSRDALTNNKSMNDGERSKPTAEIFNWCILSAISVGTCGYILTPKRMTVVVVLLARVRAYSKPEHVPRTRRYNQNIQEYRVLICAGLLAGKYTAALVRLVQ
jgi:hypothetical protein